MLIELTRGAFPGYLEAAGGRVRMALINFGSQLANWVGQKEGQPPLDLMDRILEETGYHAYIDDGSDEGHDRWDNVLELRRVAAEHQDLESFLEQVALVSDQDTLEGNANAPTLLTLHAAKGLEFPVVFITGLNDGVLPHNRSFDDPEAMQEERRLFYVGITRAKDRLFLTLAQNRSSYGFGEPVSPSRYLDDIPYDLIDESKPARPQKSSSRSIDYRPTRWEIGGSETNSSSNHKERTALQQQFAPGMRVLHPVWGEGMVLNSRIQDEDEIVDVHFTEIGLKRLAASLARLEIKT